MFLASIRSNSCTLCPEKTVRPAIIMDRMGLCAVKQTLQTGLCVKSLYPWTAATTSTISYSR